MLFVALGGPIDTAIFATGKIKSYQLWLSGEIFLNIIICYILFKLSFGPIWAFVVKISVEAVITFTRLLFLARVGIPFLTAMRRVVIPLFGVTIVSCGIAIAIFTFANFPSTWAGVITSSLTFEIALTATVWFLILDNAKRSMVIQKIKQSLPFKA